MDYLIKDFKLKNDLYEIKIFQNKINEIELVRNKTIKLVKIN